jgi:hypothetical protein
VKTPCLSRAKHFGRLRPTDSDLAEGDTRSVNIPAKDFLRSQLMADCPKAAVLDFPRLSRVCLRVRVDFLTQSATSVRSWLI